MGDRVAEIERACNEMEARGIRIKRTSSLWESKPMYVTDQDLFLNGVCEVETDLLPDQLLTQLQNIETSMGRKKIIDKGPRNIDLDILLYGDRTADSETLKIPHPLMKERLFVLRPLSQLIPDKSIDPSKPWKLVADCLNELLDSEPNELLSTVVPLGRNQFLRPLDPKRRTSVMAIINVTPDSFSGDGLLQAQLGNTDARKETEGRESYAKPIQAVCRHAISNGAHILDIGGQSTRPGSTRIPPEQEIERLIPAVREAVTLREQHSDIPRVNQTLISVDTYFAKVADAAIAAGADIINDVSSGTLSDDMLSVAAKTGATYIMMHVRGDPSTMGSLASYPPRTGETKNDAIVRAVAEELLERVAAAEAAGVRRWRIILDPGLGFAKATSAQNFAVLGGLPTLRAWPGLEGFPWLVGPSRKRFLAGESPKRREVRTAAAVVAAVQGGADIVRVHQVRGGAEAVWVAESVWRDVNLPEPVFEVTGYCSSDSDT